MSDIHTLQTRIKKFHEERSWSHNAKDIAIDLTLEAAEFLDHFKWRNNEELDAYIGKHQEDINDELSDVLHAVLLLAQVMHIDVMDAFEKKMKKNEVRYPANRK